MANILEMLQNELGDSVISQAGKFLGEGDSVVKSAMGAALPSILGSMISKGSSTSGAAGILDMLTKGNHDGNVFNNLGGLFGGGDATSSLLNSGGGILKSLLGNNLGSVVDLIASVSGMKKSSSSSLMSMAAPLVMGMVGRYVKNKALDAVGLSKFLGSQSRHVSSALPSGMGNLLGLATGNTGEKVTRQAEKMVAETADTGGSMLSKLLPLALIALLGYGAWSYFGSAAKSAVSAAGDVVENAADATANAAGNVVDAAGNAVDATANAAGNAVGAAADATKDAAGAVVDAAGSAVDAATAAARTALSSINFAAGSVGEKFAAFMASGSTEAQTFRFNNLNFASGKADITAETITEVDNLAAVLKAYPNVHIEVSGHTDNTGSAALNQTLSEARAVAVKGQLMAQGISGDRISTVGHGPNKPTASNDTAEGKKQNRRIEVAITKR